MARPTDWIIRNNSDQSNKIIENYSDFPQYDEKIIEGEEPVKESKEDFYVKLELSLLYKLLEYAQKNINNEIQLMRLVANVAKGSKEGKNLINEDLDRLTYDITDDEAEFLRRLADLPDYS